MKAYNRRMSMKKWADVLRLYRQGKNYKARVLSQRMDKCGHCQEYSIKDKQDEIHACPRDNRCPFYTGDGCHPYVMEAIRIIILEEDKKRVIEQIKKVQYLVMTDKPLSDFTEEEEAK